MKRRLLGSLLLTGLLLAGDGAFAEPASQKGRRDAGERSSVTKRDEAGPAAPQPKLDLNSATADELSTLPGIGPKRARAIVAYRERHRFARTRELRRIRGIGPKTFQRLQAHVMVGVGPTSRGSAAVAPGGQPRAIPRR